MLLLLKASERASELHIRQIQLMGWEVSPNVLMTSAHKSTPALLAALAPITDCSAMPNAAVSCIRELHQLRNRYTR